MLSAARMRRTDSSTSSLVTSGVNRWPWCVVHSATMLRCSMILFLLFYFIIDPLKCIDRSGEAQHVEWSKIQTPTDEVVVPYDTLAPTPDGNFCVLFVWIWWYNRSICLSRESDLMQIRQRWRTSWTSLWCWSLMEAWGQLWVALVLSTLNLILFILYYII